MNKEKSISLIALALLASLIVGCSSNLKDGDQKEKSPKEQALGRWLANNGTKFEFFEDGTYTTQKTDKTDITGGQMNGKWTILSDGRFKLTTSVLGVTQVMTFNASFPDDSTMTIMVDGESAELKRE